MDKLELKGRIETLRKGTNQALKDIANEEGLIVRDVIEVVTEYINPDTDKEINVLWHCADIVEDYALITKLHDIQLTIDEIKARLSNYI